MLLTGDWPQVLREHRTAPSEAGSVAARAVAAARTLRDRDLGCTGWAVHLAHDGLRVVVVEAWRDAASYRRAGRHPEPGDPPATSALYRRAVTTGLDPTPVTDPAAGVIVIDGFPVWPPLVRPVSAFTVRNGRAFSGSPGCVSTTVLRGTAAGRIATYARWRTTEDFLAAFSATQGTAVESTDDVNRATAAMTRGLLRTDYHSYELVDADDGLS